MKPKHTLAALASLATYVALNGFPDFQSARAQSPPAPAGVRAQAVLPDGSLVDDFLIVEGARSVHVLNAPSPAATASLPIGRHVAKVAASKLVRPAFISV